MRLIAASFHCPAQLGSRASGKVALEAPMLAAAFWLSPDLPAFAALAPGLQQGVLMEWEVSEAQLGISRKETATVRKGITVLSRELQCLQVLR